MMSKAERLRYGAPFRDDPIACAGKTTKTYATNANSPSITRPKCKVSLIKTQCLRERICKMVQGLTKQHKKSISDVGFGSMLEMQNPHILINLLNWLASKFDPSSRCIKLDGLVLPINK